MLLSLKELQGYTVRAADGELGTVVDFYFDDKEWFIRYLQVDTSAWLDGKHALIASDSLRQPSRESMVFPIGLSMEQVKNGLHAKADEARQNVPLPAGSEPTLPPAPSSPGDNTTQPDRADRSLHSAQEVMGYRIQARDGQAGKVEDFLVSDENWHIQFMVVDTGTWLAGRKILTALQWVEQISESEETVTMDLAQDTIGNSPEYDPAALNS